MTANNSESNSQLQSSNQLQHKLQCLLETLQLDDAPAGGAVVVYHHGKQLANVHIGQALADTEWHGDTLSLNFSTGKGVLVTLIHVLVSNGLLDYDEPIATYWPAFSNNAKATISLKEVLTHQAKLYDISSITTSASDMLDWPAMLNKVANMSSSNPANEQAQSAYSALVSGWVLGGLIEKVTHLSLNEALRHYLTEPLGIADKVYFGVPKDKVTQVAQLVKNFDRHLTDIENKSTKSSTKPKLKFDSANTLGRYQKLPSYDCWQRLTQLAVVADKSQSQLNSVPSKSDNRFDSTVAPLTTAAINRLYFDMQSLKYVDFKRALLPAPKAPLDYYNATSLMATIPAANGVASASALAVIYAMLANGGRWQGKTFIDTDTMQRATHIEVTGKDAVMPASNPNSMLWRLGYHRILSVCHEASSGFGHMGYNGSFAYCDPSRHLAVAFTHNFDVTMMTDIRQFAVTEAVFGWIDAIENQQ